MAPSRTNAAFIQLFFGNIGIVVAAISGIFMVPFYLGAVSQRLFGLWIATGGIIGWLSLLDLGIAAVVGQRIANALALKDKKAIGSYYLSGIILQAIVAVFTVSLGFILSPLIPLAFSVSEDERTTLTGCLQISGVSLGLTVLGNGQKSIADAVLRPFIASLMIPVQSVFSIVVTISLLYFDYGLFSIPIGTLVGAFVYFFVTIISTLILLQGQGVVWFFSLSVLLEVLKISPAMFFGKMSGHIANHMDSALVAYAIAPEIAVTYNMTKSAATIARLALDKITGAIYASYAHKLAECRFENAIGITVNILSLHTGIAIVMLTAYVAFNHSFIQIYLGENLFAGFIITCLFALATWCSATNSLLTTLLTATGNFAQSSFFIGAECLARIPLMIAFTYMFGSLGIPIATILTGGVMIFFCLWGLANKLGAAKAEMVESIFSTDRILRMCASLCVSIGLGSLLIADSTPKFIFAVLISVTTSLVAVFAWNDILRTSLKSLNSNVKFGYRLPGKRRF